MWLDNSRLRKFAKRIESDVKAARKRKLLPEEHLKWEVDSGVQLARLQGVNAGLRVTRQLIMLAESFEYGSRKDLVRAMKKSYDEAVSSFASATAACETADWQFREGRDG